MKGEKTSKRTRFVATHRSGDGTLSRFKNNNGKTYDYEQALEVIEQGMIEGVLPFTRRDGARHIREISDRDESTNLHSLEEL